MLEDIGSKFIWSFVVYVLLLLSATHALHTGELPRRSDCHQVMFIVKLTPWRGELFPMLSDSSHLPAFL